MLRECFLATETGRLATVEGHVNRANYLEILEEKHAGVHMGEQQQKPGQCPAALG